MRLAPRIELTDMEREQLEKLSRGRSFPKRIVERARIILLAFEGKQNREIAETLGVTRRTVGRWRSRFATQGMAGIEKDAPRPGRRRWRGTRAQIYTSFFYAARYWPRQRFVVAKAEHGAMGANPRFLLTSLSEFPPDILYRAYCERGQCENLIKDLKNALQADRLSCSAFQANFFRLLLHALAYRLLHALRQRVALHSAELGRAQFDTLRLRLLKVAAWVNQSVRRIRVRLPKAFPLAELFYRLCAPWQAPPTAT